MTNEEFMLVYDDYLMHHGVKGQHWGVRRYQNKDGSLTSVGKARQAKADNLKSNVQKIKTAIRDEKDAYRMYTNLGLDTKGYEKSKLRNKPQSHIDKMHSDRVKALKGELKGNKKELRDMKRVDKMASKQDKIANKIHALEIKNAKLRKKTDKYYKQELAGKITMNDVSEKTRDTRRKLAKLDSKTEKLLKKHASLNKKIGKLDPKEQKIGQAETIKLLNEIGSRNTNNYKLVKTIRGYQDEYS